MDALTVAIRSRDREAFDREISTRDPGFAATAAGIYRNLAELPLTALTFRLGALERDLTPARRALLGPAATARQVAVTWQVTDDAGPAEHLIWLTFLPDRAAPIAGTTDGPLERTAQPLWLLEPLTIAQARSTTVLAGPGASGERWLASGGAAVAALRSRLPSGLDRRWTRRLVFEVPSTRQVFERVLGVTPGSYGQIAAVAWPAGPDPAQAAIRIVVNPELASRLDQQSRHVLVTHEAAHVATRSAASPAPTWLIEGYADYLAYDAYPKTAERAASGLLARVRARGAPRTLPADADFAPSAADLDQRYAESWLACRYLARRYSSASLGRFYLLVDSGTEVEQALKSALGVTEREFTTGWADSLRSAARRRDGWG